MAVETADQTNPVQDTAPPVGPGERTLGDVRPGVSGSICLFRETELTPERAIETLTVLGSLIGWAQAQRAKVIAVIEPQVRDEAQNTQGLDKRVDPVAVARIGESMAESLAATEIACALRLPDRTCRQRFTGPEVLVTTDAATLAGLTDHDGTLEGYGPLSPDVARGIAAMAGAFTPLLTDDHGNLLAIGRKRRLPSPVVRQWLRVHDETCRFPQQLPRDEPPPF